MLRQILRLLRWFLFDILIPVNFENFVRRIRFLLFHHISVIEEIVNNFIGFIGLYIVFRSHLLAHVLNFFKDLLILGGFNHHLDVVGQGILFQGNFLMVIRISCLSKASLPDSSGFLVDILSDILIRQNSFRILGI